MNNFKTSMEQAALGMEFQSRRLGVTSENISNADTPGFKRKMLVPQATFAEEVKIRPADVVLDQTIGQQTYDPQHPMADAAGYVTGSNVSLIVEMADMREANRMYEANLNSFQQVRNMYSSLIDILRR